MGECLGGSVMAQGSNRLSSKHSDEDPVSMM